MRRHSRKLPMVLVPLVLLLLPMPLGAQTEREVRLPATDGKLSLLALTRAVLDEYGYSGSPLAFDGRVIVLVGGDDHGVVAFDPADGSTVWESEPGGGREKCLMSRTCIWPTSAGDSRCTSLRSKTAPSPSKSTKLTS